MSENIYDALYANKQRLMEVLECNADLIDRVRSLEEQVRVLTDAVTALKLKSNHERAGEQKDKPDGQRWPCGWSSDTDWLEASVSGGDIFIEVYEKAKVHGQKSAQVMLLRKHVTELRDWLNKALGNE